MEAMNTQNQEMTRFLKLIDDHKISDAVIKEYIRVIQKGHTDFNQRNNAQIWEYDDEISLNLQFCYVEEDNIRIEREGK